MARILSHHDVTLAEDGKRALELLEGGEHFDVVLCDLSMPTLNGVDVYRTIENRRPGAGARFVFVSGGVTDPRVQEFLERVGKPCIDKPFDSDELREIVLLRSA